MSTFLKPGKLAVGPIDSGSWGSGGKGKISDYIASKEFPDFAISHNSHNASHITVFDDGTQYKFNALPSSTSCKSTKVVMGADAAVHLNQLLKEIEDWNLTEDRLFLHPNLMVVTKEQIDWEVKNLAHIGSTMSGVGAAKGQKVMRHASSLTASEVPELKKYLRNTNKLVVDWLREGQKGLLETAQGFDLSLDLTYDNNGAVDKFFPACTSRNINPAAFLGMSFVPPQLTGSVILNLRSFPIRVGDNSNSEGNIILKFADGSEKAYNETDIIDGLTMTAEEFRTRSFEYEGKLLNNKTFLGVIRLGSSGKCYPDQKEMSWEEVSKLVGSHTKEKTSLTTRVRRVFTRSEQQIQTSTMACMPTHISINFVNYLDPKITGMSGQITKKQLEEFPKVLEYVKWVEANQYWANTEHAAKVALLGTGAKRSEILEVI